MNQLSKGKFKSIINPLSVTIKCLTFTPSESQGITKLLGMANGMVEYKGLPSQIGDGKFLIRFMENGKLILERKNSTQSGLALEFKEIDTLIDLINDSVQLLLVTQTHRPEPRGTGYNPPRDPDIIDGTG